MNDFTKEEGDKCVNEECKGIYEWGEVENCSCHINPPCSSCTDNELVCSECGFTEYCWEYCDE
jgi:hypothetical protein